MCDRPLPASEAEIEVTSEMLEAGISIHNLFFPGDDLGMRADYIYRAMEFVRCTTEAKKRSASGESPATAEPHTHSQD